MTREAPVFQMRQVSLAFGGLKAVVDVNLDLPQGILHGLIGPNGAGKTSVFNLITGVYQADAGDILLDGRRINGLKPHQITRAGIARTFQNIRLFGDLTVLDNVRIGCHTHARGNLVQAILRTPGHGRTEHAMDIEARRILRIFGLDAWIDESARNLPYGAQRRLEIARALATGAKVLLLDEPAAGTHPGEKADLAKLIRSVREQFNLTILLIEHDMSLVMGLCDRITVLDHGQIIACGTPQEVQTDPRVIEAYLGEPAQQGKEP